MLFNRLGLLAFKQGNYHWITMAQRKYKPESREVLLLNSLPISSLKWIIVGFYWFSFHLFENAFPSSLVGLFVLKTSTTGRVVKHSLSEKSFVSVHLGQGINPRPGCLYDNVDIWFCHSKENRKLSPGISISELPRLGKIQTLLLWILFFPGKNGYLWQFKTIYY